MAKSAKSRVTLKQVAASAGVTTATASMALRNHPRISVNTRDAVLAAAKSLGYVVNPAVSDVMSAIRTGGGVSELRSIGIFYGTLVPVAENPEIVGVLRRAGEKGISIEVLHVAGGQIDLRKTPAIVRNRNFDALMLVGVIEWKEEDLKFVCESFADRPVVWASAASSLDMIPTCSIDHFETAYRATRKALELGYGSPALVLNHFVPDDVRHRFTGGFVAALDTVGDARKRVFRLKQKDRFHQPLDDSDEQGRMRRWLKRVKPDVLALAHVEMEPFLADGGYRVPEDIGLMELDLAESDRGKRAGLIQQHELIGVTAVDLLERQIRRNETLVSHTIPSCVMMAEWADGMSLPPRNGA